MTIKRTVALAGMVSLLTGCGGDLPQTSMQGEKPTHARYTDGLEAFIRRDFDSAIVEFTAVLEADPEFTLARHDRGNAWLMKGDYDKAIIDTPPSSTIIRNMPVHTPIEPERGEGSGSTRRRRLITKPPWSWNRTRPMPSVA